MGVESRDAIGVQRWSQQFCRKRVRFDLGSANRKGHPLLRSERLSCVWTLNPPLIRRLVSRIQQLHVHSEIA